ncbi:DNRLRE domain-containing protein [bacterium]|nr:DNRLRE domain-containing protein [bacterium]
MSMSIKLTLLILLVPCLLFAGKINIPIEDFVNITGREGDNQILVKFDLPEDLTERSHIVSAELCLNIPIPTLETASRSQPELRVMRVNRDWDERTTGSSFYADSNEVDQGKYEVEFVNSEGQTCIDVKDFIYDWVQHEIPNMGLIILPNSKRVHLSPFEGRTESLGELKLKYLPLAR